MSEYTSDVVVVDAALEQWIDALCPVSGEERRIARREIGQLSKDQMLDYGSDWLDVMLPRVPSGWLARVGQIIVYTSQQAPRIVETLGQRSGPWLPQREAMARAKEDLRASASLKTWGGSR